MAETPRGRLGYADYLALEHESGVRHEFRDGEAVAMAGGTPRSSRLRVNLAGLVAGALGDHACQAYDSDLKIRVPATGLATYPDLAVICGPLAHDAEDRNAVTNPTVLFEVLSPSTELWDRGGKFQHFQRLDSLQAYVLVGLGEPRVEVFARQADDAWLYRSYGPGERVDLPSIELSLSVDRLYRNLPEDPPEPEA